MLGWFQHAMNQIDYYICPGCGDDVRVGSKGCPKCNHLDPWEIEDNEIYDGLDLPEDSEGEPMRNRRINLQPVWAVTAVLLLAILLVLALRGRW